MAAEDETYYLHRAEAEIEIAMRENHAGAVRAHYELAGYYLGRVYGPGGAISDNRIGDTDARDG